jgi:hypothetical protein
MLHSYNEHVRQTQGDILLLSMRAKPNMALFDIVG